MYLFQFQVEAQDYSTEREVEDFVLNRVSLDQAVNKATCIPYQREIIRLTIFNGLDTEQIADCVGVSSEEVSKTLRGLGPSILEAIRGTPLANNFAM